MLSEGFSQNSILQSKGSVNPYVNWKDLANYEFLLPPKDQQARLAELLWAGDAVVEKLIRVQQSIDTSIWASVKSSRERLQKSPFVLLQELIDGITAGVSVRCQKESTEKDSKFVLKTSSVTGRSFDPYEAKSILPSQYNRLKDPVRKGTILINRKNTPELVGKTKFIEKDYPNTYLPDLIWEIKANENRVAPRFLWYYLSSTFFRSQIRSIYSGTSLSMVNISQKRFLSLKLKIPSKRQQKAELVRLKKLELALDATRNKITASKALQKSLINQIF